MLSNRVFQIAFLVSLITHGIVLFQDTRLNLPSLNKSKQNLEVSYIKSPPPRLQDFKDTVIPRKALPVKEPSKFAFEKRTPPPFIDVNKEIIFNKPSFLKPDVIAVKKKINLPPVDMDKMSNPSYISYYQIIREKIRRAAYQNYTRTEIGYIYISFVISCDGFLKETRFVQEKSSSSLFLRDVALKSIKDASPFPNFPKELDYPQLSFNVVISFEIE